MIYIKIGKLLTKRQYLFSLEWLNSWKLNIRNVHKVILPDAIWVYTDKPNTDIKNSFEGKHTKTSEYPNVIIS